MSELVGILREQALVSEHDLARAEEVRAHAGVRLPAALVRLGLLGEAELARTIADTTQHALISRADFPEGPPSIGNLNPRFLRRHSILPLQTEDNRLTVAMADPEDAEAIKALEFATGGTIEVKVATFSDIEDALIASNLDDSSIGDIANDYERGALDDIERLAESESDAPIIRLVHRLVTNAVNRKASDIHIEPMARYLCVRYRIDGQLLEVERLPDSFSGPVATRIKILSNLDIAESRLPQDGRMRLTVRGRDVDIRVSTSPITWGESIVLRILGRSEVPLDLDRLGLPPVALAKLRRALERPHGIILLTGPTGSGKTTTLYAALNHLRRPEVKILTVEDPVEILIEGVNQVQVKSEIGLSYANTLRAFLRQDPDILMIGEIRDRETAEIALRAALTGHLVLSTLHTNSAAGAFTRLSDIGIEPYLVASTMVATIAQRLVRTLCPHCKVPREPSEEEVRLFAEANLDVSATMYDAAGCSHCMDSGYLGRRPIIEILEVDEAMRAAIRDGTTEQRADEVPLAERLAGHGLAIAAAGETTIEETRRAVELG